MYICKGIINTGSISSVVTPEICCEVFMPITLNQPKVEVEFLYRGISDLRYYNRRLKGKKVECDLIELHFKRTYNNTVVLEDNTLVIPEIFKKQLYKDMSVLFVKAIQEVQPNYTTFKSYDLDSLKCKLKYELKDLDSSNLHTYIREPYRKVN